jgi:hypothetical protein
MNRLVVDLIIHYRVGDDLRQAGLIAEIQIIATQACLSPASSKICSQDVSSPLSLGGRLFPDLGRLLLSEPSHYNTNRSILVWEEGQYRPAG